MTAALHELCRRVLRGRLSRNGLFALVQGVFTTLAAFLVYRLVILDVGLDRFGVWSLLMACAMVARLLDVSGGGAVARFVATASLGGRGEFGARDYVDTVVTTSLVLNLALGLALWAVAPLALPLFLRDPYLNEAWPLVPWAIAASILGALAYAPISAIDGAQRADLRAAVVVGATLVFVAASAILVPQFGIVGFAAAQVVQQVTMLLVGWAVLRRHVVGLGWAPSGWRRDVFMETTVYALRLNAIGALSLLFEPLAKFAFNNAGGPGLVALFELATRLVTQFRALIVTAAAPLLPAFAAQPNARDAAFRALLEKATRIAVPGAVGITIAALSAAPLASLLVLDGLSPELIGMNAALTAGWAVNTLALPFYFAAQGLGALRWNFAGQALIAISVIVGAFFMVPIAGTPGLIGAIVAGLVFATLVTLLGNAHAFGALDIVAGLRRYLLLGVVAVVSLCLTSGLAIIMAGI